MTSPNSTFSNDGIHHWSPTVAPFTAPELWGMPLERRTTATTAPAYPAHITMERLGTAEGLLVVARCTACGGRLERLLDFREVANLERHQMEAAINAMEASADAGIGPWAAAHSGCTVAPRHHHACLDVAQFLQMEHDTAVADIRAGEPLANELLVLMNDLSIFSMPLGDLPLIKGYDRGRVRTMATHAFHAMLREHARRTSTWPLAAVFAGDAWLSMSVGGGLMERDQMEDLEAQPYLAVMAATPDAVMLGMAPITREPGVQGVGPGEVGQMTHDLLKTGCPLTDGLFATSGVL